MAPAKEGSARRHSGGPPITELTDNPEKDLPTRTEVVVVGAGLIGLAIARELDLRGVSTAVVDRSLDLTTSAAHVAAGMLAPVGELDFGEAGLLGMNLASARLYPGFVAELEAETGLDTGYGRAGGLHVALDSDEAAQLRRMLDLHIESGLTSGWLGPGRARELEPGLDPVLRGAVFAEDDGSVDPRLLRAALDQYLRSRGVPVARGVEVAELEARSGALKAIRTTGGNRVEAGTVVIAAGADSGRLQWLEPDLRPPVRPVKGQVVELAGDPGDPVAGRIIASERVYVVPRPDGRVVVGATVEEEGFDRGVTAGGVHELLREAYRLLPEVAELSFVGAQASLRPGTPDNLPVVGRSPRLAGLVYATGHYRNGVLLTPLTARSVGEMVSQGEEFAPGMEGADPSRLADRAGVGAE